MCLKVCTKFSLIILAFACSIVAQGQITIENVKINFQTNPTNVDGANITITWEILADQVAFMQSSVELRVATDSTEILSGGNLILEKSFSDQRQQIKVTIPEWKPNQCYTVAIKSFDEKNGISNWGFGSFKSGIRADFGSAKWINSMLDEKADFASYFKKTFQLSNSVKTADLYIASGGVHQIFLNGESPFNSLLNPVFVNFTKHIPYNHYDITRFLNGNELNALGIILGNGWYNYNAQNDWNFQAAPWRNRPLLKYRLIITYVDGQKEEWVSDSNDQVAKGPMRYNALYLGEVMEFNQHQENWSHPYLSNSMQWKSSNTVDFQAQLVAQNIPPIVVSDTLVATEIRKINNRHYFYSFPANVSGIINARIFGKAGTEISLNYGEQFNANNYQVDVSNMTHHINGPTPEVGFQQDKIRFITDGYASFQNIFSYKGFQYVQINANQDISLSSVDIKSLFVHTDVKKLGSFSSNSSTINQIFELINRSYLSNLHGFPTDCPQREKNGWTADGYIMLQAGMYSYDAYPIYRKWIQDHKDAQRSNGAIPMIVPTSGWGFDNATFDWTCSTVIVPWELYMFSGDLNVLEESYPMMVKFMEHWNSKAFKGIISNGLGDWNFASVKSNTDFISTVLYYHAAMIMFETSLLLNKNAESIEFSKISQETYSQLNSRFFNSSENIYAGGTQTELAVALYYQIVPKHLIPTIAKKLSELVILSDYHLTGGLFGSKTVLPALAHNGYEDIALKVATQTTAPSWGAWLNYGATTGMESWGYTGYRYGGSQNHPYFGGINEYLYRYLAGIQIIENYPGFENFKLIPGYYSGLHDVSTSYQSVKGMISINWVRTSEDDFTITLTIPANTKGRLYVPEHLIVSRFQTSHIDYDDLLYKALSLPQNQLLQLPGGKYEIELSKGERQPALGIGEEKQVLNELKIESNKIVFEVLNNQIPDTGSFVAFDISGKLLFPEQRITEFSQQTTLLSLSELAVFEGQTIVFRLSATKMNKQETHEIKFRIKTSK